MWINNYGFIELLDWAVDFSTYLVESLVCIWEVNKGSDYKIKGQLSVSFEYDA